MAVQKSDLHRNGNKTSRFRVTFGCAAVPVGFAASSWIVGSWPLGWAALPAVWGECEAAQGFFRGDCGCTNYIYLYHSFVSQLQVCLVCVYVESFCGLAHSVDWLGNSNGGKDTWGELVNIDGKFIQLYLGVTRLQLRTTTVRRKPDSVVIPRNLSVAEVFSDAWVAKAWVFFNQSSKASNFYLRISEFPRRPSRHTMHTESHERNLILVWSQRLTFYVCLFWIYASCSNHFGGCMQIFLDAAELCSCWLGPPGTRLWRHQERGTTSWGRFGIQMITGLQVSLLSFWCICFGTVPIWINQWYESMHCNEEVANFGTWILAILGPSKSEMYQAFKAMELKLHLVT